MFAAMFMTKVWCPSTKIVPHLQRDREGHMTSHHFIYFLLQQVHFLSVHLKMLRSIKSKQQLRAMQTVLCQDYFSTGYVGGVHNTCGNFGGMEGYFCVQKEEILERRKG